MSFRELRTFTEIMRSLGYPRLISMESFRTPNFELVSDILNWLVHRYDPLLQIPYEIASEQERVQFLKLVAQVMYNKARIKLNKKKLYLADGYAVKELLKISQLLYGSMRRNPDDAEKAAQDFSIASKLNDLKLTRTLASEITTQGAAIYDLLGSELELREARLRAVARPVDTDEVERTIQAQINAVAEQTEAVQHKLDNLAADEQNLEAKLEKKKVDLDRSQNRLKSLQSVRPAFMDEYERLEGDLQRLYAVYLERFRNLEYLENELDSIQRAELEAQEEAKHGGKAAGAGGGAAGGKKQPGKRGGNGGNDDDSDESDDDAGGGSGGAKAVSKGHMRGGEESGSDDDDDESDLSDDESDSAQDDQDDGSDLDGDDNAAEEDESEGEEGEEQEEEGGMSDNDF